jgi:A/G-specific adenine glycosylase
MISVAKFQKIIYDYYRKHGRKLPWRFEKDPYKILVSEIMLQQTQVARVLIKYPQFLKKFPTISSLAQATLQEVLQEWSGLGCNRRALYLHLCAKEITRNNKGTIPRDINSLDKLPGIGEATAGAIRVYAFNEPAVFIETNTRTVFLYFFFQNETNKITDAEILSLIRKTLDRKNPREWYYALTDYGAMLKKAKRYSNIQSKHYVKQSKFIGSDRQIRGIILRELIQQKTCSVKELQFVTKVSQKRLVILLNQLKREGLINIKQETVSIMHS